MIEPTVYIETWDVSAKLGELGLEEEHLMRPVEHGLSAWASCTPNHPLVASGWWAWAETVCGLRDELIPVGWERSNEANLPMTVNPDTTVAICVNTGDEDTGVEKGTPCTRSKKGPRTRRAVLENLGQRVLFIDELPTKEVVVRSGRAVWILLVHRDVEAREVRAELSQPISITDDGKVDGWLERIILTSTPFDDDLISIIEDGNGPQNPEIDIEIKKRA